jgi:hypothetical protein
MLLFQKNGECKNHKKTRKNMKHETKVTGGGTWNER